MRNIMNLSALSNIKQKFYTLFSQHPAIFLTIGIVIALYSASFQMAVGIHHNKFFSELIKVFFNFIALQVAILGIIKNINFFSKNKSLLRELFITFVITAVIFNFIVEFNPILNNLVYMFYPTPLTQAILDDAAAIPWAFVVVGINIVIGVLLYLLQNKKVAGLNKIIHNGLLAYAFLTIAVWFFSHFSYVGSNYIYMANNIKIIDGIVENHIKNNTPIPSSLPIQTYKNFEELQYYTFKQNIERLKHDSTQQFNESKSRELSMLGNWFNQVKAKNLGQVPLKNMTTNDVRDFSNWVFFVLNFPQGQAMPDKWIAVDLIFPQKVDAKTSLIKHGLFYVRKQNDVYYTFITFDKTFKQNHQNLIFNAFYSLFHFVYWALFIYLIRHHKKHVFKKETL